MILLAEPEATLLAAKKKRQHGALETATFTPKNRVWVFANIPSGRPCSEPDLSWETATGSVQYSYENASGRGEFISRDPLSGAEFSQGTNLYAYCGNNFLNASDPTGMCLLDGKLTAGGDYELHGNYYDDLIGGITLTSSNARVDDDGSPESTGDPDIDPSTSASMDEAGDILPNKSGTPLNPFNTPYAVAPLDLYSGNGGLINPGDDATVIANGTVQDAPVGDFGPTGNGAGEGSPALWDNAGVQWQPTANGPVTTGADTPVTVIYWPTVGPH